MDYVNLGIGLLLIPASFHANRHWGTRMELLTAAVAAGNLWCGVK